MRILLALILAFVLANTATAQLQVVYSPVPAVAYQPIVPVYSPVVAAPTVAYYAPPAVAVTPVYTTRYRPFLGGSITRVRNVYSPVTYVAPPPVAVPAVPAAPCCY